MFCSWTLCTNIVGLFGNRTILELVSKTTVDTWSAGPTEQVCSYLVLLKLPSTHHWSYWP